jgi:hypothetical protein
MNNMAIYTVPQAHECWQMVVIDDDAIHYLYNGEVTPLELMLKFTGVSNGSRLMQMFLTDSITTEIH